MINIRKFILTVLLGISLNSYAVDGKWLESINSLSLKEVTEEVKKLERLLKKNENDGLLNAKIGICYHYIAKETGKNSNKAIAALTKSYDSTKDPLTKAFLGSAMTLRGGESKNLAILSQGLELIDQAREDKPDEYGILLLRISNAVGMPDFILDHYSRAQIIEYDIEEGEKWYKENKITEEMYLEILYIKSKFLIKQSNLKGAVEIWNNIAINHPQSKSAALSRIELKKYSE